MQFPGCPCHIRLSEHSGDHSHAVNAGAVQLRNVVRCNAADGNHRNADCLPDVAQHGIGQQGGVMLGAGVKTAPQPRYVAPAFSAATASATLCALVPMIALSPRISRACCTFMSRCPTWTPSAPSTLAASTSSSMMQGIPALRHRFKSDTPARSAALWYSSFPGSAAW